MTTPQVPVPDTANKGKRRQERIQPDWPFDWFTCKDDAAPAFATEAVYSAQRVLEQLERQSPRKTAVVDLVKSVYELFEHTIVFLKGELKRDARLREMEDVHRAIAVLALPRESAKLASLLTLQKNFRNAANEDAVEFQKRLLQARSDKLLEIARLPPNESIRMEIYKFHLHHSSSPTMMNIGDDVVSAIVGAASAARLAPPPTANISKRRLSEDAAATWPFHWISLEHENVPSFARQALEDAKELEVRLRGTDVSAEEINEVNDICDLFQAKVDMVDQEMSKAAHERNMKEVHRALALLALPREYAKEECLDKLYMTTSKQHLDAMTKIQKGRRQKISEFAYNAFAGYKTSVPKYMKQIYKTDAPVNVMKDIGDAAVSAIVNYS